MQYLETRYAGIPVLRRLFPIPFQHNDTFSKNKKKTLLARNRALSISIVAIINCNNYFQQKAVTR